jgi:hypothetical protein
MYKFLKSRQGLLAVKRDTFFRVKVFEKQAGAACREEGND